MQITINNKNEFDIYKNQIPADLDSVDNVISVSSSIIPITTASQYISVPMDSVQYSSSYMNKIIDTDFNEFIIYPEQLNSDGLILISKSEYLVLETDFRSKSSSVDYNQFVFNSEIRALEYRNISLKNTANSINLSTVKVIDNLTKNKYYNNSQLIDIMSGISDTLKMSYDNILISDYKLENKEYSFYNEIYVPIITSDPFMNTTISYVQYESIESTNSIMYDFNVIDENIFTSTHKLWENTFSNELELSDLKLNINVVPLSVTDVETVNEYNNWVNNLKFFIKCQDVPNQYVYTFFNLENKNSFLTHTVVPKNKYFTLNLESIDDNFTLDTGSSYFKFYLQSNTTSYTGSNITDTIQLYDFNKTTSYNLYINKEQLSFYGYNLDDSGQSGVLPAELNLGIIWSKNPTQINSRYLFLYPNYDQLNLVDIDWKYEDIIQFESFRKGLILVIRGVDDPTIVRKFYTDSNGNFDFLQLNDINLPFGKYKLNFEGTGKNQYNKSFKTEYIWFYYIDDNNIEHSININEFQDYGNGSREFEILKNGRGYLFKFNILWINALYQTNFGITPNNYKVNQSVIYDLPFNYNNPENYWGNNTTPAKFKWWLNNSLVNMLDCYNLNGIRETFSTAPNGIESLFTDYKVYNSEKQLYDWTNIFNSILIKITTSIPYSSMTAEQQNTYNTWINTAIIKFEFEDSTTNKPYSLSSHFIKETDYKHGNQNGGMLRLEELIKYVYPAVLSKWDWLRLPWPWKNFPNTHNVKPWFKIKFNKDYSEYNTYYYSIMTDKHTRPAEMWVGDKNYSFIKEDINTRKFPLMLNTSDLSNGMSTPPTTYSINLEIEYIVK